VFHAVLAAHDFLDLGEGHSNSDAFTVFPVDPWTGPQPNGQRRCHHHGTQNHRQ
jgi:hypothetical protein